MASSVPVSSMGGVALDSGWNGTIETSPNPQSGEVSNARATATDFGVAARVIDQFAAQTIAAGPEAFVRLWPLSRILPALRSSAVRGRTE